MRLKITSLLAASALALSACDCFQDDCCLEASGQGALDAAEAQAAAEACVPGSVADFVQTAGDRVFFDFDRQSVRPEGKETLHKQAEWLNKYPHYVVTVTGHCDKRGTVEYNMALGERRANAAAKELMAMGVAKERIHVVSYGKNRPVVEQDGSEWAYQQNRVAITVLD